MKFIDLFAGIGGFRYGLEKANDIRNSQEKGSEGLQKDKSDIESDSRRSRQTLGSLNTQKNREGTTEKTNNEKENRERLYKKRRYGIYTEEGFANRNINKGKDARQFSCVYSDEWDKYAAQIYNKNFSNSRLGGDSKEDLRLSGGQETLHSSGTDLSQDQRPDGRTLNSSYSEVDTRDIRTVNTSEIPDHDLLCGGFPCQAFSIAGKRAGFNDTRGTLFFEIARILRDKRPRYFLLENVKGLLSHDEGKTFQTILGVLSDLGYEYQWQVLNSKNFGVPQNRERVFIVGHLRGKSRPKVFPIRKANGTTDEGHKQENTPGEVAQTVRNRYGNGTGSHVIRTPLKFLQRNQKNIEGDYSFTVDKANTGGVRQDMKIRRLTPTECERLQGFPDGWTSEGLSSIMEICVDMTDVIEKVLPAGDIALCTTRGGSVMELRSYPNELKSDVSIVVDQPLLVNSVIDTISRGNDMVMLYNQKETLTSVEQIKKNLTSGTTGEKSTKKLLSLSLKGNWNEEKLSTILTLIKETIASPTSLFAKIDENTIGVIIHLKKQELNFSKEALFGLRMASIFPISDTQRYKCLGNAVTTNVVTWIGEQLINNL